MGEDEIDEEENAQKETEKNRLGALLKHRVTDRIVQRVFTIMEVSWLLGLVLLLTC